MTISKKTRFEVFKRDGFACQYCGAAPPLCVLHVDHRIPVVAKGGGDNEGNLITSCQPCNLGKGARPLDLPDSDRLISESAISGLPKEARVFMRRAHGYTRSLGGFYHVPAGPYIVSVNDAAEDPVEVDFFAKDGSGAWIWDVPKGAWDRGRVLDTIASWAPAG